jgi:hypothetical protein
MTSPAKPKSIVERTGERTGKNNRTMINRLSPTKTGRRNIK